MGLNYALSPLTRIWAKYLHQLDRRATDYLELRLKYFIIVRMNSSRSELESTISLLGLILLMSTSAIIEEWCTLFLVLCVIIMQLRQNLIDHIMVSIYYFIFLVLTYPNPHFLQLCPKSTTTYIRLFQLLTLFTALFDARSYRLYYGIIIFIIFPIALPLSTYCGVNSLSKSSC